MTFPLYVIFLPIFLSLFCLLFRKAAGWIALLTSALVFVVSVYLFFLGGVNSPILGFKAFKLNESIFMAAAFLTFLIILYSMKFMEGKKRTREYYAYLLVTLGSTAGALFAADYLLLLCFWGISGATLYMLIGIGGEEAAGAAKKSLLIIAGSDALMILGIAIIWGATNSFQIGARPLVPTGFLPGIAFLCLTAGAFAKAGAIPLHTWIPDSAEFAPTTVMALLPGALDKLLGIYLLLRICFNIFILETNSPLSLFLMAMGSITIIVGVMGALLQHNIKKLLSFHAVSQVGYMVLGIGTGVPVAIAGGVFHMFNNAIYKALLFLIGGAVERQTRTTELDRLGGLAKFMPITFICTLIAALSISGVPPFNGFVSKWMIYQGIVELAKNSPYWIIWLLAAMFGSALTLASFMKIIHAVFLGQWSDTTAKTREAPWPMCFPMITLAVLCVLFGVFAYALPLAYLILPSFQAVNFPGIWNPTLATALLIIGLLAGLLIYSLGNLKTTTSKPAYIGGEIFEEKTVKVTGTEFYNTIRDWGPLDRIYHLAEKKYFDIYELGKSFVFWVGAGLSWLQNGRAHTYLAWMLLGSIVLVYFLVR